MTASDEWSRNWLTDSTGSPAQLGGGVAENVNAGLAEPCCRQVVAGPAVDGLGQERLEPISAA